jgi:uncharacterized protein (TIGR00661 family)
LKKEERLKILYGLPSEGMGHATRSNVIISHLAKTHDVKIATSDRAYAFMKERFPGMVYEIKGFHLAYKDGGIAKYSTAAMLLKNAPKDLIANIHKYCQVHKEFKPDLVISDFDSFTFFFAKLNKIPLISIDNIQVMDRCKLDFPIPEPEKNSYQLAKNIIKAKVPNAAYYLITSFFEAEPCKKNTAIIPPILREKILNATSKAGEHILVYQTSSSQNNIIPMLKQIPQIKIFVYGFNKSEIHDNVILKKFSEDEFIGDLSSAKGIISNGGFSLLSEAVYLKKPVCSIPVKGQFEQYINAAYIEKCGYGRHFNDFSPDLIKSFLFDIDIFQRNINQYKQNGNDETFRKLDEIINLFTK